MKERDGIAMLSFDPALASLRDGLSVAQQISDTLWVANDETTSLERLTIQGAAPGEVVQCNEHRSFELSQYLKLPVPPEPGEDVVEIDIEGLAYADDGYLWLTGSHSLKRTKADKDETAKDNIKRLSKVKSDGNRYLLARIPVVQRDGSVELASEADGGKRTAARLSGDDDGNDLTREIAADKHLRDFLCIPGKDNGFDIEGLAVIGKRILLGLRGPVLRGCAMLLEIEPKLDDDSADTLVLKRIGPEGRRYRKHFFMLDGLGVRDLCMSGGDLLILAGPTMDLDGPVSVFRWRASFDADQEQVVFNKQLDELLNVPYGKGVDHAEGMCLFTATGQTQQHLLILYDSAKGERKPGDTDVEGDLFQLS